MKNLNSIFAAYLVGDFLCVLPVGSAPAHRAARRDIDASKTHCTVIDNGERSASAS